MIWDFASFSTVFQLYQLYQEDREGIMRESLCASELFLCPQFRPPSVHLSVTLWQLRNSRTAYARILKLYMWHVHEK